MIVAMEDSWHLPVLLEQSVDMLLIKSTGVYFDGTFGGGGHSREILRRLGPQGRLTACDADPSAVERGHKLVESDRRLQLEHMSFGMMCSTLADEGVRLDGAILDLGVSSRQLDSESIGLSYRIDTPLDMRFDPDSGRPSAAELLAGSSPEDLATLLRTYGEEPAAWKIANAIVDAGNRQAIETTGRLREVIAETIPERFLTKTLSRVFQALRIAVNDELEELKRALECLIERLLTGGRLVVLSYHSLEDRIVKERFRAGAKGCICPPELPVCRCGKTRDVKIITRKPITPSQEEIAANNRARSAKMRVAEKVEE